MSLGWRQRGPAVGRGVVCHQWLPQDAEATELPKGCCPQPTGPRLPAEAGRL